MGRGGVGWEDSFICHCRFVVYSELNTHFFVVVEYSFTLILEGFKVPGDGDHCFLIFKLER